MLAFYWGEGGEYGPFPLQEDGWPDAGQVVRYFRKKAGMRLRQFGKVYGEKVNVDHSPISERWISEMETENKVPTDITRRRAIVEVLNIPPMLLGLAVIEELTLQAQPQLRTRTSTGHAILQRSKVNLTKYKLHLQSRWQLHETSNAHATLLEIYQDLQELQALSSQAQGDLLYSMNEMIFSNYLLLGLIQADMRHYELAYDAANHAVKVAKTLQDPELLAAAKYSRGFRLLTWGLYGQTENGSFIFNDSLVQKAAKNFEEAKQGAHPELQGFIYSQLARAHATLKQKTSALVNLDDAAIMIGGKLDDPYTRSLVTATFTGFHQGRYLTERALVMNALDQPGQALLALKELRTLRSGTYGKDETRRSGWLDIITADAYLKLEDHERAAAYLKKAIPTIKDVKSQHNIIIAKDLYRRLLLSPYRKSQDVQEAEEMVQEL